MLIQLRNIFFIFTISLFLTSCKGAVAYWLGKGLRDTMDNPDSWLAYAFTGGIAGIICGVPAIWLIKVSADKFKEDDWWPLILGGVAGAVGGLCLGIPVGIGMFLYVLLSDKGASKK